MKKIIIISVAVLILVIGVFMAKGSDKLNYDEFAQCLTEKGAVMYGVYWCHYCNLQKEELGGSFKFINYVECSVDKEECIEKEIQGFPSWIINGVTYRGKQSLSRLSALTECKLPEVEK